MNRAFTKLLLLGVLGIEIIVPAVMLVTTEPPRRYAWSMFVRSSTTYRYTAATRDGRRLQLDPAEAGEPWRRIHYGPHTLHRLCERHPDVALIVRYYNDDLERTQQC